MFLQAVDRKGPASFYGWRVHQRENVTGAERRRRWTGDVTQCGEGRRNVRKEGRGERSVHGTEEGIEGKYSNRKERK